MTERAEAPYAAGVGGEPAAGATPLEVSAKLRVPVYRDGAARGEFMQKLAWYVLDTAHARGDLAELRLNASRSLEADRRVWQAMEGYQVGAGKLSTQADHDRAKAQFNPDLARRMREAKWVVDECEREMDRLDKDAIRCQAVHAIIAGG